MGSFISGSNVYFFRTTILFKKVNNHFLEIRSKNIGTTRNNHVLKFDRIDIFSKPSFQISLLCKLPIPQTIKLADIPWSHPQYLVNVMKLFLLPTRNFKGNLSLLEQYSNIESFSNDNYYLEFGTTTHNFLAQCVIRNTKVTYTTLFCWIEQTKTAFSAIFRLFLLISCWLPTFIFDIQIKTDVKLDFWIPNCIKVAKSNLIFSCGYLEMALPHRTWKGWIFFSNRLRFA